MLTMTTASDPRTIIDDHGNAYQVLGGGGEADGLSPLMALGRTEKLQRILESDAAALVLIIVADPVTGLGCALETERSIEGARATWVSSTDTLMKVWRRARRRVRMINRACLSGDESAQAALNSIGLAGAAAELRFSYPTPVMASPLSLLCATMMIQADPTLQRLARELETATIGADSKVDLWNTTSEAWLAASQQEALLGSLRAEAEYAAVIEQRLAEATSLSQAKSNALFESEANLAKGEAKLAAVTKQVSELEQGLAQTTAALREQAAIHEKTLEKLTTAEAVTKQVSELEQGLAQTTAALREQATLHEKTLEKLTTAEQELELLRETVRLQSDALRDAMARQPQFNSLTSQVKKLEVATVAMRHRLSRVNEDLRVAHASRESLKEDLRAARASRGSLENELEDLRHQARFAKISDSEGYTGILRSLPLVSAKGTGGAIRYQRPDEFIPSDVQIRDDWTENLQIGEGGERIGREIVSRRKSGHVFFGPYATLPAGSYAADVQLNLRSGVFKSEGYCLEVVSGDEVIASSSLRLARGQNRFLLPFRVSTGRTVSELEVRLYSPGASDIAITKLRLLESASNSPAAEQNAAASAQTEDQGATLSLQGTASQASV